MHISKYIYLRMSPILILFVPIVLSSTLTSDEYLKRKLITRNDTLNWLKILDVKNSSSPYCDLCCVKISNEIIGKTCGTHTMCIYPSNAIGASCRGYISIQLTKDEKVALVDVHNSLRNKVALGSETGGDSGPQPPASNMRILQWNEELSAIARRWVAQCIFSHDLCRDTALYPVGQNLARGNLATDSELSLIVKWYEEVNKFDKNEVDSFKFPSNGLHTSGRYTQLVWADTSQIGCARAIFQQSDGAKLSYVEHLVCNYGPTGNIPDQMVYKVGRPCSSCPEGMACALEYSGLCEAGMEEVNLQKDLPSSNSDLRSASFVFLLLSSPIFSFLVLR